MGAQVSNCSALVYCLSPSLVPNSCTKLEPEPLIKYNATSPRRHRRRTSPAVHPHALLLQQLEESALGLLVIRRIRVCPELEIYFHRANPPVVPNFHPSRWAREASRGGSRANWTGQITR